MSDQGRGYCSCGGERGNVLQYDWSGAGLQVEWGGAGNAAFRLTVAISWLTLPTPNFKSIYKTYNHKRNELK